MIKRLTFKDIVGKEFTLYTVTRGGSIRKSIVKAQYNKSFFDGYEKIPMDASALHLNKKGNIDIGWGYACFINADEAAELATRIVTTKYNNSIKQIKKVTNT